MKPSVTTDSPGLAENWARSMQEGGFTGGPGWLQALRSGAAREFAASGLPGKKDEQWKYTSLRRLEDARPAIRGAGPGTRVRKRPAPPAGGVHGFGFGYADGRMEWLGEQVPPGVSMRALDEVFCRSGEPMLDRLRPLLETIDSRGPTHAFEALNTALLNEGLIIHVAAGVDAGICHAQWNLGADGTAHLSNIRIVILLEEGAKLTLVDQFQGMAQSEAKQAGNPGNKARQALNLVVQAEMAADSVLEHVRLQSAGGESILLTFNQVQQAERSSYAYSGFDVGGGLVRHVIDCRLAGAGARAEINGAFVLDQERHVDHHVCIDHLAPSCHSEQFFRGVLDGRSRAVFNGRAVIRPGADGSRVRQSSANLLLSDLAEIDTKPELEIYADEVEASHGATVGSLDEQAVFYLRSRGIAEGAARRMLTAAFCQAVSSRLRDADLAAQAAALLEAAMPGL